MKTSLDGYTISLQTVVLSKLGQHEKSGDFKLLNIR